MDDCVYVNLSIHYYDSRQNDAIFLDIITS